MYTDQLCFSRDVIFILQFLGVILSIVLNLVCDRVALFLGSYCFIKCRWGILIDVYRAFICHSYRNFRFFKYSSLVSNC